MATSAPEPGSIALTSTTTCILHGSFEDKLPADSIDNSAEVSGPGANTIFSLLAHFDIDPEKVQHVILNGQYLDEDNWADPLPAQATIRFWPRLAGG